jgi:phosphoglycolate phosphatase
MSSTIARNVLFDLDGVLADPKAGIFNCTRYALDRLSRPCPSDKALSRFIGPPLRSMFAALLETSDKELIERAVGLYRERFAEMGVYEAQPYAGVPGMLEACSSDMSALFVATSKPTVFAKRILTHLRLDRYFIGIYGAQLDGTFDDKGELIRHLLTAEHMAPGAAIMVGDRGVDIVAAKANRLQSVGVLWGYGTYDELHAAGADKLCAMPQELHDRLKQLFDL